MPKNSAESMDGVLKLIREAGCPECAIISARLAASAAFQDLSCVPGLEQAASLALKFSALGLLLRQPGETGGLLSGECEKCSQRGACKTRHQDSPAPAVNVVAMPELARSLAILELLPECAKTGALFLGISILADLTGSLKLGPQELAIVKALVVMLDGIRQKVSHETKLEKECSGCPALTSCPSAAAAKVRQDKRGETARSN